MMRFCTDSVRHYVSFQTMHTVFFSLMLSFYLPPAKAKRINLGLWSDSVGKKLDTSSGLGFFLDFSPLLSVFQKQKKRGR